MTLDRREGPDELGRSMGQRLVLLALAAVVATVGIALVIDGLRNADHIRLLIGAVITLAAAVWSAAASRSR